MRKTATGSSVEAGTESAEDHVSGRASGADESAGNQGDARESPADGEPDRADPEQPDGGSGADADATADASTTFEVAADPHPGGDLPAGHDQDSTERVAFRRPPGMVPPPDHPDGEDADRHPEHGASAPRGLGTPPVAYATNLSTGALPTISSNPQVSAPTRWETLATNPGAVRVRPFDPSAAIGSARVQEAVRAARAASGPRGPRRARLSVKRLDPWSVMKFSFAVSLVLFIVMIVAASVLYLALDTMGVFTSVNNTLADLVEGGGAAGEGFRITASGVIGTAAVLGAINVVLFTALATLGAFIYNVCADLVGGVEVTLAERN